MEKIFITYSESRSGGEISEGQEDTAWPNYDPEYIEVQLGELMLKSKGHLLSGEEIEVNFNPAEYIGKPLYLLFVRYTTGGTFGYSEGNPCFPACYATAEEAFETKSKIEDGTWDGGAGSYGYIPWVGYFESLDSVEVVVKQLLDNS